jgi:hypothetical protein
LPAPANRPDDGVVPPEERIDRLVSRHLAAGWVGLAVYVVLGSVLEVFHATKAPLFVDAGSEATRLLLRLAHAHGTLLSLVNLAFAATLRFRPAAGAGPVASTALLAALVVLPLGFFLGALGASGGDPGLGVVLVPPGALALFVGAVGAARRVG